MAGFWNPTQATGEPIGTAFTDETYITWTIATAQLNGHPVAISGSGDDVRVWDLATGLPIGGPFAGNIRSVDAVATTQLDGHA